MKSKTVNSFTVKKDSFIMAAIVFTIALASSLFCLVYSKNSTAPFNLSLAPFIGVNIMLTAIIGLLLYFLGKKYFFSDKSEVDILTLIGCLVVGAVIGGFTIFFSIMLLGM